jgi:hypothetical protein
MINLYHWNNAKDSVVGGVPHDRRRGPPFSYSTQQHFIATNPLPASCVGAVNLDESLFPHWVLHRV